MGIITDITAAPTTEVATTVGGITARAITVAGVGTQADMGAVVTAEADIDLGDCQ